MADKVRTAASNIQKFAVAALNEMKTAVLPQEASKSALRGAERASAAATANATAATTTDIATTQQEPASAFSSFMQDAKNKLGGHPFFKRLKAATAPVGDFAEDMRLRWETSDSALVHRLDDFMTESEAAKALREIRARDPLFDMVEFLRHLKQDVRAVISAYLAGKQQEVAEFCTPDMAERLTGILKAQAEAGLHPDPTLLDTSEVELVDVKWADDAPIVVVQFTCQQINCTRDSHGNVVEGAADEVHRVYYYWALAQEEVGYMGSDRAWHPPRWRLKEMLVRGMHHLL